MTVHLSLKPEEFILLVSIARKFGFDREFEISMKDMTEVLFASRKAVYNLIAKLKKHDVLRISEGAKVRGKGRNCYTFYSALVEHLEHRQLFNQLLQNDDAINRILSNDSSLSFRRKQKDSPFPKVMQLRSSHRLFLSILALNADRYGCVNNLSRAEICQLMGRISGSRFKSQLDTLIEAGLVQIYFPGGADSYLFGKMKGVFYLNYTHPVFSDRAKVLKRYKVHVPVIVRSTEQTEASALMEVASSIYPDNNHDIASGKARRYPLLDPFDMLPNIGKLLGCFTTNSDEKNRSVALYVHDRYQLMLYQIATYFLNHHIDDIDDTDFLNADEREEDKKQLLELISVERMKASIPTSCWADFKQWPLAKMISVSEFDQATPLNLFRTLMVVCLNQALTVARRFKYLMTLVTDDADFTHCCLLPVFEYQALVTNFEYLAKGANDSAYSHLELEDKKHDEASGMVASANEHDFVVTSKNEVVKTVRAIDLNSALVAMPRAHKDRGSAE
ncbi:hypothetical protein [Vibrio sp. M260118]|uniref:hypothetical protein n=1 Tax=Vibrio sp. M260118 TaxID=3020896 RepID=UPI002F419F03